MLHTIDKYIVRLFIQILSDTITEDNGDDTQLSQPSRASVFPTVFHVHQMKNQISLYICAIWSEF